MRTSNVAAVRGSDRDERTMYKERRFCGEVSEENISKDVL
jgi:hypothetical protein